MADKPAGRLTDGRTDGQRSGFLALICILMKRNAWKVLSNFVVKELELESN